MKLQGRSGDEKAHVKLACLPWQPFTLLISWDLLAQNLWNLILAAFVSAVSHYYVHLSFFRFVHTRVPFKGICLRSFEQWPLPLHLMEKIDVQNHAGMFLHNGSSYFLFC